MILWGCTDVSPSFITTCSHGQIGCKLSCRCCGCCLYYGVIRWQLVTTRVPGCSSRTVVVLYGVRVKVDPFSLSTLSCHPNVCILDWCARVWAEIVVVTSLYWLICSCLMFSPFGFLLFLFVPFLAFPDVLEYFG